MSTRTNTIQHSSSGSAKTSSIKEICNRALTAKSEWLDKVSIRIS